MENNSPAVKEESRDDYVKTLEQQNAKKDAVISYLKGRNHKLESRASNNSTGSVNTAISNSPVKQPDDKVSQFLDVQQDLIRNIFGEDFATPEGSARKRRRDESADSSFTLLKRPRSAQIFDLNPEAESTQIGEQLNVSQITAPLLEKTGKNVTDVAEVSVELRQELVEAKQKIAELESKLVEANKKSDSYSIQFASLHRTLAEANEQVSFFSNKNAEYIKLLGEHDEVRRAKLFADTKICELTEENASLRTRTGLHKQEIMVLKLGLEESEIKVAELNNQIEDTAKERDHVVHNLEVQANKKLSDKDYIGSMELWLRAIGVEQSGRNDVTVLANFWANVAVCWDHGLSRMDMALHAIETAISLNPSNPLFYHDRTVYSERLNKSVDTAVELYKTSEFNLNDAYGESKLAEFEQK